MSMRVLVTGGAGRLGVEVCKSLIQSGCKARILDLPNRRNHTRMRALRGKAEIYWGSITDPETIQGALEDVDIVVHMAAILPPLADEKPELADSVNMGGMKNLIEAVKARQRIPVIFVSSVAVFGPTPDATTPLSTTNHTPAPAGAYARTKYQAENMVRNSGLDYAILRFTATTYLSFEMGDLPRIFDIPVNNRVEFCHPSDAVAAVINAVNNIEVITGKTLIVSGGSGQRMIYRDLVGGILDTMGLPFPPESKFESHPYSLDWYDTAESEQLLRYQHHNFSDYISDFKNTLSKRYTRLFIPFMKYFISPVFGRAIVQRM